MPKNGKKRMNKPRKYGGGGIAEVYEDARKDQPTGRLSDRDVSEAILKTARTTARKDQPTGRLSDRDIGRAVKRAGLK